MKNLFLLCLIALSFNLYSAELDCNIRVNQGKKFERKISTLLDQKVNIGSLEGVFAYITEKTKKHFVVEAYLVDYDLRFYGEGSLRESEDKVIASAWGRDSMVDIECRLSSRSR